MSRKLRKIRTRGQPQAGPIPKSKSRLPIRGKRLVRRVIPGVAASNMEEFDGGGGGGGGGGGSSGGGGGGAQEEQQPQEQAQEEQPQEQAQEEQPQEGSQAGNEISFPLISSHRANGRLNTVAICATPNGYGLIHCRTRGPSGNGPVNFGVETHPAVNAQRQILLQKAQEEKQKQKAGELVERARCGDQNAMAIIACVRDNAKKGSPRASYSAKLIKTYIDEHPANNFGYDEEKSNKDYFSSVMLANGMPLTGKRINKTIFAFGEDSDVFRHGFVHGKIESRLNNLEKQLDGLQLQIYRLGVIVGQAKKIQDVRAPGSRISAFCCDVGWELGE